MENPDYALAAEPKPTAKVKINHHHHHNSQPKYTKPTPKLNHHCSQNQRNSHPKSIIATTIVKIHKIIPKINHHHPGAAQHNLGPKAKNLCGAFNM